MRIKFLKEIDVELKDIPNTAWGGLQRRMQIFDPKTAKIFGQDVTPLEIPPQRPHAPPRFFGSAIPTDAPMPHYFAVGVIVELPDEMAQGYLDSGAAEVNVSPQGPRISWDEWPEVADDSAIVAAKTPGDVQDQVTVAVVVETIQATITTPKGEQTIDLPSKQVARWLKVLCDHPREWIPAPDLMKFDSELDGARTSILNRSLKNDACCSELAKLIETDNHRGARFNPDLASKRNRAPRRATKC